MAVHSSKNNWQCQIIELFKTKPGTENVLFMGKDIIEDFHWTNFIFTFFPFRLFTTGTLSSPVKVFISSLLGFRHLCRFCFGFWNGENSTSALFWKKKRNVFLFSFSFSWQKSPIMEPLLTRILRRGQLLCPQIISEKSVFIIWWRNSTEPDVSTVLTHCYIQILRREKQPIHSGAIGCLQILK